MSRNLFISIFFVLLASGGTGKRAVQANGLILPKQKSHFPNIAEVKQFGDTVRLEIEKNGNVYIKHYIDLKQKGFNDSYTATCVYSEIQSDTSLRSDFYITLADFALYFDRHKILKFCDSILTGKGDISEKKYCKALKLYILGPSDILYYGVETALMQEFNCKIVNRKNQETQKSLLIESYSTEFSGGKNYYIISQKNDTIPFFHFNDYMR